jgi:hypothetical protein
MVKFDMENAGLNCGAYAPDELRRDQIIDCISIIWYSIRENP